MKTMQIIVCVVFLILFPVVTWAQNGVPDECEPYPYLACDFDRDGYVGISDLGIAALNWLEQDCGLLNPCGGADIFDYDGKVNSSDFGLCAKNWGKCTDATNPNCIHEPLTLLDPPSKASPAAAPSSGSGKCSLAAGKQTQGVSLHSGEFRVSEVDLRIPGRGMGFIWQRTYRSRTGANTGMSNRREHSYNIYLSQCGANLLLHDGDGRRDFYYPLADGSWAGDGFSRVLEQEEDGSFTMTFADKGSWAFRPFDDPNAPGRISAITGRKGNSIGFDYDPNALLTTITDTLDRSYTIGRNDANDITSVSADWAGLAVTYEYYGPGDPNGCEGDLKSASVPDKGTTTYTYSTGFGEEERNHNLLTITDGKGQTWLQNTYSANAKVIQQTLGGPNDKTNMTYTTVVPDPNNNYAVTKTVTNDRMGNVDERFFDNMNRLVILREYTGRADPNQPTYLDPDTNPPVDKLRPSDPNYFETRYAYNADSKVTRIDYPNGNYVINVYEADLDPDAPVRMRGNLRERHRFAGALEAVSDQNDIVELFEYDSGVGSCCGSGFVSRSVDGRGNETLNDYDSQGNRIRTIYVRQAPDPNIVEEWEYDLLGRMTAHILPDNGSGHRRRDEYTYHEVPGNPGDALLKDTIIDANNLALTTTYEYDWMGNTTVMTDPNGHTTDYAYNSRNQLITEISPEVTDGSGIRYQTDRYYDENGNLVRTDVANIDDAGVTAANSLISTTYEYDVQDNLIRRTAEVDETDSVVTEYEYDDNENRTLTRSGEATNGNQPTNVVRTLYDERDRVYQATRAEGDPNQSTTQYDYDSNGNRVRVEQGLEGTPRVRTYDYDGYNRLIQLNDPMGNETTWTYDENSNRTSQRTDGELVDVPGDAVNVRLSETTYVYDDIDRLTRTEVEFFDPNTQAAIDDGLSVTETEYSDNSQVLVVTDDNGNETTTTYDTANRRSVVTDAMDNTVTYSYDENSNIISETEVEKSDLGDPDETFVTTYQYDNLDRRTSVTDNVGNTTGFSYDSRHNQTMMIDARSNETRYEYDGLDRLVSTARDMDDDGADQSDADDIVTTQSWDDNSRLTGQGDDKGNTTSYEYDALNRRTAERYADETVESSTYDVHNNKLTITDGNGSVSTCTYDMLDRITGKSIVVGAGVSGDTTESYAYDGMSRLVYAEDDDSLVTFSYDSLSNVISETLNGKTTDYTHDGLRNKLSCTYPGGRVVSYTYDALNRIKTIGSIADYDYIGSSRVEKKELGNGTKMVFDYDGARRITGTTHTKISGGTVIDDRTYAWDEVYNKTQRADARAGGPGLTHDYTYDDADRLIYTDVTGSATRTSDYTLDGVGNRTSVDAGNYTMDNTTPEPADDQMNQYTDTSFDSRLYDKNGNLITIDNGEPNQKDITYDYDNRMVEFDDASTGQVHTYSYDALGRRIEKVVDSTGTPQTTRYLYDLWQVIEEQDGSDVTQATYVYGNYIDEVLTMQRSGNDYYYHADDLFNVMALTDAGGNVVERYEYEDYGRPVDFNSLTPISGPASGVGNPYLFTGRRYDPETACYHYRTRYLDPSAGRFTTRDSIGIWSDILAIGNGYTYAGNSPLSLIDPQGMKCKGCTTWDCKDYTPVAAGSDNRECTKWSKVIVPFPVGIVINSGKPYKWVRRCFYTVRKYVLLRGAVNMDCGTTGYDTTWFFQTRSSWSRPNNDESAPKRDRDCSPRFWRSSCKCP